MTTSARGITKTVHSSEQAAFCALMVAARKQAGLTQHELARRLKRPQSFVAKYEGGERRMDVVEFVASHDGFVEADGGFDKLTGPDLHRVVDHLEGLVAAGKVARK